MSILGPLISAGASLAGGFLNSNNAKDAAEKQAALAREFAQNGIKWKVEDAKRSGVHPLYALGAPTISPGSVYVGDSSMGNAVSSMGQNISRAMSATATQGERDDSFTKTSQALQLENMGLQNELLKSRVATSRAQIGPPMPPVLDPPGIPEKNKHDDRPPLYMGGTKWGTDPLTTNQESFEKRYGDDGPISWLTQAMIGYNDLKANSGGWTPEHRGNLMWEILKRIDRETSIKSPDFTKYKWHE